MSIFHSLIRKEVLHLLRDPRTVTVVLVMPVVLLLLFGFAISTEVNGVRLLAVVGQHTDETHRLLERFRSNPYFTLEGIVAPHEADDLLRQGKADAVLVLRTDDGQLTHQVITDASNTNLAQTATAYIESVVSGTSPSPVVLHTLYNPQLKSAYQFVPGIMGMIFILICSMMTSVSIVSERESGTMDLLLVSPVRPRTIILGKLVPYFLLSCLLLGLMLTLSYTVLGLPFSPSALHVVWLSLLYIVLALGLGMLVSTLVATQVAALLGMIFPVENMPVALQGVSCLIPARWYISALRVLMIQQLPVRHILPQTAVLALMTLVVLTLAAKKFNLRK